MNPTLSEMSRARSRGFLEREIEGDLTTEESEGESSADGEAEDGDDDEAGMAIAEEVEEDVTEEDDADVLCVPFAAALVSVFLPIALRALLRLMLAPLSCFSSSSFSAAFETAEDDDDDCAGACASNSGFDMDERRRSE